MFFGKSFKFVKTGGFSLKTNIKIVNDHKEEIAFSQDGGSGIFAKFQLTSQKKDGEVLMTYSEGKFINVYGETVAELYGKDFNCRKPFLLKTSDGATFHLRTKSLLKTLLKAPREYVLYGDNGEEATYKVNTSPFRCKITDNPQAVLPQEVILVLGVLLFFSLSYKISDATDISRVIQAEDNEDFRDAKIGYRIAGVLFLLALLGVIGKIIKLFD
ncbi:MAG: hypothetical protein IKA22_10695 [Lentisphaeria bacterium]|nr:hypothetical protein [Lentisphaeria bacterium]MBR2626141.1 hypothetical protein [Lentisphaeria bacterium]